MRGRVVVRKDVGIIVWDWTRRSDWQGVIPWLVWDVKEGRKESQAGVDGMCQVGGSVLVSGVWDLRGENVEWEDWMVVGEGLEESLVLPRSY